MLSVSPRYYCGMPVRLADTIEKASGYMLQKMQLMPEAFLFNFKEKPVDIAGTI
jgi:hypothetical protein